MVAAVEMAAAREGRVAAAARAAVVAVAKVVTKVGVGVAWAARAVEVGLKAGTEQQEAFVEAEAAAMARHKRMRQQC